MIHIYEKVCKTDNNAYGICEVKDENPFIKGPCIITILALPLTLKNVNGSLRQTASLVNPDIDTTYDPDKRIMGLSFGEERETGSFTNFNPSEEDLDIFVSTYFSPLFMKDGEKINIYEAMKNFRNLTFVAYCNGAKKYYLIELVIKKKMLEAGYSDGDIRLILSQVCLASIGGNFLKKHDVSALSISFGDVMDADYESNPNIINSISELDSRRGFINYGNSLGFAILSSDEHDFKRYMTGDPNISPFIKAFINASIDNALDNRNNDIINPITYEKIENALDSVSSKIK